MELVKDVHEIYAMKGKRIVHYNLKKDSPSEADLKAILLGPTGNLRAPAIRKGKILLVGFDEEVYRKVIG